MNEDFQTDQCQVAIPTRIWAHGFQGADLEGLWGFVSIFLILLTSFSSKQSKAFPISKTKKQLELS